MKKTCTVKRLSSQFKTNFNAIVTRTCGMNAEKDKLSKIKSPEVDQCVAGDASG